MAAATCPHGCRRCRLIEAGVDPSMPLGPREMMSMLVEPPPDPDALVYSDASISLALDVEMLRLAHEDAGRQVGAAMTAVHDAAGDAERREAEALLADAQGQREDLGARLEKAMSASTTAMRREGAAHHAAIYARGLDEQREAGQERSSSRLSRLKRSRA